MDSMRILPVIDLLGGQVVHGQAGQRHLYRPVRSILTDDSAPSAVAAAFVTRLGLRDVYVADLDAIERAAPSWDAYDQIVAQGVCIWLDAGVTDTMFCRQLFARYGDALEVVVGLETLHSADELRAILDELGADRIVVSLDLICGAPRTHVAAWQTQSASAIAEELGRLGVYRWILLDVSRVGTGQGTGTQDLCRQLRREHQEWQLICGGGIARVDDIRALANDGVNGVLLASTLHDGRIGKAEIAGLRNPSTRSAMQSPAPPCSEMP